VGNDGVDSTSVHTGMGHVAQQRGRYG
jgi:hypothetical protein